MEQNIIYKIVWEGWGPRTSHFEHDDDHQNCSHVTYFNSWESVKRSIKSNRRKDYKIYSTFVNWVPEEIDDDGNNVSS